MNGYFDYLCREVGIGGPKGRPYRHLAYYLLDFPFESTLSGDLNREADGMVMREGYSDAPDGVCSVFEVLVALCRSMKYMSDGMMKKGENEASEWFMEMITNLGISAMTDEQWDEYPSDASRVVTDQVRIWLDREYEYDGTGGIFPLEHPHDDQTKVELWYQMNAYLMEKIELS